MTDIVTFIVKDVGRDTYGAVAYSGNNCVWFSGDNLSREEAERRLAEWEKEHKEAKG